MAPVGDLYRRVQTDRKSKLFLFWRIYALTFDKITNGGFI